ncbi:hypothetical protein HDV02_004181 [Globomyces sp. JEL0801]|nr:hypothetical protein HDV02_004181 [Globomyces sp. JEL0801]
MAGMDLFDWWSPDHSDVVEKSIQVYKKLEKYKKVDAIMGFSQGASLVEILDRLVLEGKIKKLWNVSVLASGVPLVVPQLDLTKQLKELSLHISGKLESDRIGLSMLHRYQRQYSKNIQHEFGHEIPKDSDFASYFHDALRATYSLVETMNDSDTNIPVEIVTPTRFRIGVIYSTKLTHYKEFCSTLLDSFDETKYTVSLIFVKIRTPSAFRRFIHDSRKEVDALLQDLDCIGPVDVLFSLPGTSSIMDKINVRVNANQSLKTWSLEIQLLSENSAKIGSYNINDDQSVFQFYDKIKGLYQLS